MPRRTYSAGRRRPHTNDGLVARLAEELSRTRPKWEERREEERANRRRNQLRSY